MAFGCIISGGLKGTFNFDSKGLYVSKPILGIITTKDKMWAHQNQHNNAIVNTMEYATCVGCGNPILHMYTTQLLLNGENLKHIEPFQPHLSQVQAVATHLHCGEILMYRYYLLPTYTSINTKGVT